VLMNAALARDRDGAVSKQTRLRHFRHHNIQSVSPWVAL
jgi:hypothetical protein